MSYQHVTVNHINKLSSPRVLLDRPTAATAPPRSARHPRPLYLLWGLVSYLYIHLQPPEAPLVAYSSSRSAGRGRSSGAYCAPPAAFAGGERVAHLQLQQHLAGPPAAHQRRQQAMCSTRRGEGRRQRQRAAVTRSLLQLELQSQAIQSTAAPNTRCWLQSLACRQHVHPPDHHRPCASLLHPGGCVGVTRNIKATENYQQQLVSMRLLLGVGSLSWRYECSWTESSCVF